MTRVVLFLCGAAALGSPAGAAGQDVKLTRNPIRTFEGLLGLWADTEAGLAESKKGRAHSDAGEFEAARGCFEKALSLIRKHFPDDSIVVGQCHGMLAAYYWSVGDPGAALPHARKHVETSDNLPAGFVLPPAQKDLKELNRGLALNNLGGILEALGDLAEAEKLYREVLAARRRLHPAAEGHFDLVATLGNLACVLSARGEHAAAAAAAEEALDMARRLSDGKPREMYDPGALARALNNLAETRRLRGDAAGAESLQEQAVRIREDAFPAGHPDLALSIRNLAIHRVDRGEWAAAAEGFEKSLGMYRKFFPADRYPHGHPMVCQVLRDLGATRAELGDHAAADRHLREALRMADALFPRATFPHGHPTLAACLTHLGAFRLRTPETREAAARHFREALSINSRVVSAQGGSLSEAGVLNLVRSFPGNLNGLLSATADGPFDPRDYQYVWATKAAVMRLAERRRRAVLSGADPEAARLDRELEGVRAELSVKLLDPARPDTTRPAARKEELERDLAARLRVPADDDRSHPFDLAAELPAGAAFVDLVGYVRVEQDPRVLGAGGFRTTPHYAAFVLSRGRRPERVELGPAGPIEEAVESWRRAIDAPGADERAAARKVGRLVWAPVARRLPDGVGTVYLCPDAALNRVPFAALPGRRPDTVLLEDLTPTVVPHGPFLLHRLRSAPPARAGRGTMLVVGDVDYGPAALPGPDGRPPPHWGPLPEGAKEAREVAAAARARGKADPVERTAADADPATVRRDLAGARFAHLATHGFFADGTFLSALGTDPAAFRLGPRDLATPATRNPLALSGLALAGANQPGRGLLLAEGIAGLRLDGMDLAVLSACETGLGTAVAGEGVFGLQRAFHLAGCRTVVASLWKVPDPATRALMEAFYRHLWAGGPDVTPAKALQAAQLELYRKPPEELARFGRGPPLVAPPIARPPALDPTPPGARADAGTHYWAAFVVSGGP